MVREGSQYTQEEQGRNRKALRHAYFFGASDPYKALKTTLKADVNEEAWATLHDTSRAFEKPRSGRIAVKVINHFGG